MPAPGQTMSICPKVVRAVVKREDSWGQEVTSVGWKWAEGEDVGG
jgi:hypothetical protein